MARIERVIGILKRSIAGESEMKAPCLVVARAVLYRCSGLEPGDLERHAQCERPAERVVGELAEHSLRAPRRRVDHHATVAGRATAEVTGIWLVLLDARDVSLPLEDGLVGEMGVSAELAKQHLALHELHARPVDGRGRRFGPADVARRDIGGVGVEREQIELMLRRWTPADAAPPAETGLLDVLDGRGAGR